MLTIGIPTVNRWDLLRPSLAFYMATFPKTFEILVVDNGCQGIAEWVLENRHMSFPNINVHTPGRNLGVSASWNFICNTANHPNFLLLNDDVCLSTPPKSLEYLALNCLCENVFLKGSLNWSSIMFNSELYAKVGPFDEQIYPAYFEDNDFSYRMKLLGISESESLNLTLARFINSGSIQKDPGLNAGGQKNRAYYIEKWGGVPGKETFTTQFNK